MIQRARWLIIAERSWATHPKYASDWAFKFVVKVYIRKKDFSSRLHQTNSQKSRSAIVELNATYLDTWTETYPPNWVLEGSIWALQALMLVLSRRTWGYYAVHDRHLRRWHIFSQRRICQPAPQLGWAAPTKSICQMVVLMHVSSQFLSETILLDPAAQFLFKQFAVSAPSFLQAVLACNLSSNNFV